MTNATQGLLLINLGSPTAPTRSAVRRFLREFLSDKRVIDLPFILRSLLLYVFILPFRPRRSAEAYQAIWTTKGSPLMIYSQALCDKVQARLGSQYQVALGMRYGQPSIAQALDALQSCEQITIIPLYPQYSSAATGSSIEKTLLELAPKTIFPSLKIIRDFHRHPAFIKAQAAQIQPWIAQHDHILFSYHGIPERHVHKTGCNPVCQTNCPSKASASGCYRAQCFKTTELLVNELGLTHYSTAFQSRLGRTPWIKPYTDSVLLTLAASGVKRLAVVCPSFVADCLETLEEIGIRAKEQWLQAGGETLTLIPCLNDNDLWVDALLAIA